MSDEKDNIPILDLENFVFTPPGPMGWTFEMTEEDVRNARQGIQNIIEAEQILSLDSLVELSVKKRQEYDVEGNGIELLEKQSDIEEVVQQNENKIDVVEMDEVIQEVKSGGVGETTQEEINSNADEEVQEEGQEQEYVEEITNATNDVMEEVEEQAVVGSKVTIILPNTPLKGPWLLNSNLKRFRN